MPHRFPTWSPPTKRTPSARPPTHVPNRPSSSNEADPTPQGDNAVSIDSDEPLVRRAENDDDRKKNTYHFDRHTSEYREQFLTITEEMQGKCPVAWTDAYDGHWVAAGSKEV